MDEQISSEAEKAQMELQAEGIPRRKARIADFIWGLVLWHLVGLVELVLLTILRSTFGSVALLGWCLIVALLFIRRWIAFGMLAAYILNLGLTWAFNTPSGGNDAPYFIFLGSLWGMLTWPLALIGCLMGNDCFSFYNWL